MTVARFSLGFPSQLFSVFKVFHSFPMFRCFSLFTNVFSHFFQYFSASSQWCRCFEYTFPPWVKYEYLLLFSFTSTRITESFRKWIVINFQLGYLEMTTKKNTFELISLNLHFTIISNIFLSTPKKALKVSVLCLYVVKYSLFHFDMRLRQ